MEADPEIKELKELVRQNLKLSQETRDMVHSIRRNERMRTFLHFFYFLLVLCSIAISYYFISPYLFQLAEFVSGIRNGAEESSGLQNQIQQILSQLPANWQEYFSSNQ